jgi:hypothetical protein
MAQIVASAITTVVFSSKGRGEPRLGEGWFLNVFSGMAFARSTTGTRRLDVQGFEPSDSPEAGAAAFGSAGCGQASA